MSVPMHRSSLTGSTSFYRSWGNPDQEKIVANQTLRRRRYLHLWDLYQGTAFDDVEFWQDYKGKHALYRQIRLLWDHVHSLVEFYATHVWHGALAHDGMNLPNGILNAIPLAPDTDPVVAQAIGQIFQSWVFQKKMVQIPRYTAAIGELLVEIVDDPEDGVPQAELVWPGRIESLSLDRDGDVASYALEYQADRPDGTSYLYRREVDKERFVTYEDRKIINEIDNPYGFCPAVWFRHIPMLGVRGEPAIYSTQGQLDELNGLFSNLFDKAHVALRAPVVVSGNISPSSFQRALTNMVGTVKRAATADLVRPHAGREELNILQGPQGTTISTIELKISEAILALEQMIASIERKCPEVTFYEQLRSMTQLTGPGASRLLGDVDKKLKSASSGYDAELKRLLQKGIAIFGMRHAEGVGVWQTQREDLAVFGGFAIEDYTSNSIKFDILPREIVPSTQEENLRIITAKKSALPFFPMEQAGREAGYDEGTVKQWIANYEQAQERAMQTQIALAEAQPPPEVKNPPGAPPGGPQRGQSGPRSSRTLPGRRDQS